MKKKSQLAGQMFIYILGFIIFAMVLLYGYNAIKNFRDRAEEVSYIKFKTDMTQTINKLSTDYGSEKRKEFIVPSGHNKVCFVDSEEGLLFNGASEYPLIKDSVKDGVEDNLFFIGPGSASPFNAGKLEVNRTGQNGDGFICAPVINGKIRLKLTGLGNRVRIEDDASNV